MGLYMSIGMGMRCESWGKGGLVWVRESYWAQCLPELNKSVWRVSGESLCSIPRVGPIRSNTLHHFTRPVIQGPVQ